ncbi:MAG TPA: tetratricopeptide repeat protein [Blastocatellia bacterium]|nr:tetratricopeptide repeat protein [Blastocatellia bacterium]
MSASTDADKPLGNIITFYSYKGGTGRSMAVANVAWILASGGKRVLTVDWDLEAPGLHRYYAPFLGDKDLTGSDGLIDLLIEFRDATATGHADDDVAGDDKWHDSYADIAAYVVSLDWEFPRGGTLDLLPAGRQGASYSARVNSFDWEEFYERRGGGVFLEAVKEKMRADYDYVLIDSRTGVSDTSGICTVQMPDAVVVCFTLNNQGIKGSAAVAHSIYEQRLRKGRDIAIFPVPMRVEPFEKIKLDLRREYSKKMFELFPSHLPPQSRAQFQEDVQVKYLPYYAYEEILATFGNRPGESESTSLLAPAEHLTYYLTDFLPGKPISRMEVSEQLLARRQAILAVFEGKQVAVDPAQLLIQSADAALAGLKPDDEKLAWRALLRLVRVATPSETGGDTRLLVRLSEFDEATQTILRNLAGTPLITIERAPDSGEAAVQLSSNDLLRHWPRMQSWIQEDREFLLWRQNLNVAIPEWKRVNEDNGALLAGAPLEQAKRWRDARVDDLNENELNYINRSVHEDERRRHEHTEREERERRNEVERRELQQQTQVLIKTSQQTQHRSRLRAGVATGALLLGSAVTGSVLYTKWNDQKIQDELLRRASQVTLDGNEEAGKKNFEKATEKYNQAISIAPSYEVAYLSRGRAYFERKQYDEALADFNETIRLNVNNAEAYIGRGNVYLQKRDFAGALDAYNRAIDLNPRLSDAYINRGKAYTEQDKLNQALDDYNRALDISHDDPLAFLWRGDAFSKSGNYDRALADFNQALRLKPDLSEANIKRADALLKRGGAGDSERAANDYNTALSQEISYNPAPYLNRGKAYKNTRKIQLAIDDFQKAIKLSQDKPEYSKIKSDASDQLRELQPMPQTQAPQRANPTIYLHYRNAKDLPMLDKLAAALNRQSRQLSYRVARSYELVTQPTNGDVRYFHKEDEPLAAKVKEIIENTLKANRIEMTLESRALLKYPKSPPLGWIEIWLPTLPQPSKEIRRPAENTPNQSRPRSQSQPQKPSGKDGPSDASAKFDNSRTESQIINKHRRVSDGCTV